MMERIAALAAGITAAVAAGVAVVARRRTAADVAPKSKRKKPGVDAGRSSKRKTDTPPTTRQKAEPAAEARQELSTAAAEEAARGSEEEAGRIIDETEGDRGRASQSDDIAAVKGIGAVSQERLRELGVTTLAQIAAWSEEDVEAIAEQIKVSPERIRREDWIGQARAAREG